jgi:hypothetical protein
MTTIILHAGFATTQVPVGGASVVAELSNMAQSGQQSFALVNSVGQIIGQVVSMVPALNPIGIQTNTLAGTLQFLKITALLNDNDPETKPEFGDYLGLMGNLSGLAASFVFLGYGAIPAAGALAGIALGTAIAGVVYSMWTSPAAQAAINELYQRVFEPNPWYDQPYPYTYLSPIFTQTDRAGIEEDFNGEVLKGFLEENSDGSYTNNWGAGDADELHGPPPPPPENEDTYACDSYHP